MWPASVIGRGGLLLGLPWSSGTVCWCLDCLGGWCLVCLCLALPIDFPRLFSLLFMCGRSLSFRWFCRLLPSLSLFVFRGRCRPAVVVRCGPLVRSLPPWWGVVCTAAVVGRGWLVLAPPRRSGVVCWCLVCLGGRAWCAGACVWPSLVVGCGCLVLGPAGRFPSLPLFAFHA